MDGQDTARALPAEAVADPVERLATLFDGHYDRLYRLARRLTGNADDARDLVQETFLKAAKSPNSVPLGTMNEEAWLVRVLINICRDQWRRASVRDRHNKSGVAVACSASPENPEALLIARTAIRLALNALPPRRRAIVVMYELEGMGIPAIASLLGISAITVRWHLSVGRRDLSRALRLYIGDTK